VSCFIGSKFKVGGLIRNVVSGTWLPRISVACFWRELYRFIVCLSSTGLPWIGWCVPVIGLPRIVVFVVICVGDYVGAVEGKPFLVVVGGFVGRLGEEGLVSCVDLEGE
jgi:hypothetical protein